MDVAIKGKGRFSLNKSDFVASGGEGSIYRKGDTAFKVYTDPSKMIPVDKIGELSVLTMPNIVKPEDVLLSGAAPIGYTMKYLKDTYALCQLFTRAFRERMGVKPDDVISLVKELRKIPEHCHSKGVLIVDLNEMNFLVDDGFSTIYAIDCDSYQTKSFPATAIMESIRDRHSNKFSEETDWFSFGIISFQMFVGIHPYKGKHPKYKTLDERMDRNISVLSKDVAIPTVCYPTTNIPQSWLDWYKAVFEGGKRIAPPTDLGSVAIVAKRARITGSNNFLIRRLLVVPEDIIGFDPWADACITCDGVYLKMSAKDSFRITKRWDKKPPAIGSTANGTTLVAQALGGKLELHDATHGVEITMGSQAEAVMAYGGTVYFKSDDRVMAVDVAEAGGKIFATPRIACQVLANATTMFDGLVVQDMLGACYASVFPASKTCYQTHIKEMDGHKIIGAKFDGGVLMAVTYYRGAYHKYVIRMSSDYSSYDLREDSDANYDSTTNFVVLPTGVAVHLNDKDELELFSASMGSASIKTFDDPALSGDMRLSRHGTQVVFARGEELYSIEVKKP